MLALHDEAIALVEVDPAPRRRAVVELEVDAPFEDVFVVLVDFLRRIGPRQAEQVAEFAGECLEIRQFRAAGLLSPGDEFPGFGGVRIVAGAIVRSVRLGVRFAHGATIAKPARRESPEFRVPARCTSRLTASQAIP